MMRWSLSAALLIIALTDLVYLFIKPVIWQVCLLTTLSFVSSIFLYILTSKTEKEYADRIESMKEQTPNNG